MKSGAHIAIIIITFITLVISIILLVVAVKIQNEVKDKLDKAEDAIQTVSDTFRQIPSSSLHVIGKKLSNLFQTQ